MLAIRCSARFTSAGASLKLVQHGALGDGAGGTGLPSGCTLDGETLAPGLQSWFDAAAAKATGNLLLFVTWGAAGAAGADASDGFALHDLDVGFDAAIDHGTESHIIFTAQSPHSHSTVTARSQHVHSTVTALCFQDAPTTQHPHSTAPQHACTAHPAHGTRHTAHITHHPSPELHTAHSTHTAPTLHPLCLQSARRVSRADPC